MRWLGCGWPGVGGFSGGGVGELCTSVLKSSMPITKTMDEVKVGGGWGLGGYVWGAAGGRVGWGWGAAMEGTECVCM